MARPKKSAAPAEQKAEQIVLAEKAKQIVLTEEQFSKLRDISDGLNRAKNTVEDIGEDRDLDLRNTGYLAGKVYITLDRLEDTLDEIIDQIDPDTEEEDDIDW